MLHPWNLAWNLNITYIIEKGKIIIQTSIFGLQHVNIPRCTSLDPHPTGSGLLRQQQGKSGWFGVPRVRGQCLKGCWWIKSCSPVEVGRLVVDLQGLNQGLSTIPGSINNTCNHPFKYRAFSWYPCKISRVDSWKTFQGHMKNLLQYIDDLWWIEGLWIVGRYFLKLWKNALRGGGVFFHKYWVVRHLFWFFG